MPNTATRQRHARARRRGTRRPRLSAAARRRTLLRDANQAIANIREAAAESVELAQWFARQLRHAAAGRAR